MQDRGDAREFPQHIFPGLLCICTDDESSLGGSISGDMVSVEVIQQLD